MSRLSMPRSRPKKKLVTIPIDQIGSASLKNLVTGEVVSAEDGFFRIEAECVSLNLFLAESVE